MLYFIGVHMKNTLCLFLFFCLMTFARDGFSQRTFTMRPASFNGKGDATIIGNRVVVGGSNTKDNHATTISYIDTDGDPVTTINSSNATFTLPSGASVYWAGLYWGGRSSNSARNTIKFKHASQSYQTLTATQLDDGNSISGAAGENHYQCFRDVTTYFQTHGSGVYWAGDVYTMTGNGGSDPYGTGYYGGWSVIIIYSDSNEINRNITVFDGYNVCWNNTITVNVSGFLTPETGTFTTKLGVITWEGDLYITDDRLRMNSNIAANNIISTSSPGNNFFNGSITGTPRSPLTNQNWGVDFDYMVSNINPPNNSSSTNLYFSSSGDFYLPGALIFSIEINPVLLPVQLTSASSSCRDGKPEIIWVTSSEINNREFEIWSSSTNKDFNKLATVAGKGTYSGTSIYRWIDESYFSGSKAFYKIVQTDFNGIRTNLSLQEVECFNSKKAPEVYPVPFTDVINIILPAEEDEVLCRLFRTDGALISEQLIQSKSNRFVFRIHDNIIPDQYYLLEISGRNYPRYRLIKSGR